MPTNKNMKDLLNKKAPSVLRQSINPVDIIEAATRTPEQEKPPERGVEKPDEITPSEKADSKHDEQKFIKDPGALSEEKKRSPQPRSKPERNSRTKKPRMYSERDIQALLVVEKREIVRYSFEAYADQKDDIQRVCDLYKQSTGHYLSASRLLREVLDSFLPGAIKAFENDER